MTKPRSERTRLRRGAARAEYSNQALLEILDAGMAAHVGVTVTGSDAKRETLRLVSNHVVPMWETGRPPADSEIRRTLVLRVPLVEMSGKVRTGGPAGDEPEDIHGPHWAGHVPINCTWDAPVRAQDLTRGIVVPSAVAAVQGRRLG